MKKIIWILITVLLIFGGVILVKKKKEELQNLPTPTPVAIVVEKAMPKVMEVNQTKGLLGRYYAIKQASIATKLPGYIKHIYTKEGAKVEKGELLLQLDSSEVEAQIAAQKALVESLKNQIEAQKALLRAAVVDERNTYKSLLRDKKLYRAGALAKEKLEMKEALYAAKKAKVASAKAALAAKQRELKAAIAALKAKEELLSYAKIKSPYEGVVAKIFFKEGSFAPLGRPLVQLLGKRWVIDATFSDGVEKGMKAKVLGRVFTINKILPQSLNSLKIARIEPANLPLPNDSQVKVDVIQKSGRGYALPIKALYEEKNNYYVFVYEKGRFKPVKIDIKILGERYFIPTPAIKEPVAIGSNEKLAKLFLQRQKSE